MHHLKDRHWCLETIAGVDDLVLDDRSCYHINFAKSRTWLDYCDQVTFAAVPGEPSQLDMTIARPQAAGGAIRLKTRLRRFDSNGVGGAGLKQRVDDLWVYVMRRSDGLDPEGKTCKRIVIEFFREGGAYGPDEYPDAPGQLKPGCPFDPVGEREPRCGEHRGAQPALPASDGDELQDDEGHGYEGTK